MKTVVTEVIAFDLNHLEGLSFADLKTVTVRQLLSEESRPRLGLFRLAELELLDKLQACYGIRILETYKETELITALVKLYALFPFNDMAMRYVTGILANTLDTGLAKAILGSK